MPGISVRLGSVCCGLWLGVAPVQADPGYYVLAPYAQAGQWGSELRYWTVKTRGGGPAVLWPELALSYGFGERWTSTVLASYEGTREEAVRLAPGTGSTRSA